MKIKHKFAAALATGALFASVCVPATFAATTVQISGNGASSVNGVTVHNSSHCTVSQSNSSIIQTEVYSSASTGGNKANQNTGGDVSIGTGDASSSVVVGVTGSSNAANNPCCGCATPSTDVAISGNGAGSVNGVTVGNHNSQTLTQTNQSLIATGVTSKAKTGKNKANKNTGGSVDVTTGGADSTVGVAVGGSTNSL